MRLRLYEHRLRFFDRISNPDFPKDRLVLKALKEHTMGGWGSTYMSGISEMEEETKVWKSNTYGDRKKILNNWGEDLVLNNLRGHDSLVALPTKPKKSWTMYPHVSETSNSQILSSFMLGNAHLGNKDSFLRHIRPELATKDLSLIHI